MALNHWSSDAASAKRRNLAPVGCGNTTLPALTSPTFESPHSTAATAPAGTAASSHVYCLYTAGSAAYSFSSCAGFGSEVDGGGVVVLGAGEDDEEASTVTGVSGPGPPVCVLSSLVTRYVITSATTTTPASTAHSAIHPLRWDFGGPPGAGASLPDGPVNGRGPVGGPG